MKKLSVTLSLCGGGNGGFQTPKARESLLYYESSTAEFLLGAS